jgi:hypothetical protein
MPEKCFSEELHRGRSESGTVSFVRRNEILPSVINPTKYLAKLKRASLLIQELLGNFP